MVLKTAELYSRASLGVNLRNISLKGRQAISPGHRPG